MYRVKGIVLFFTIFHSFFFQKASAQVIRILPMGNSITYDETTYDVPPNVRPPGARISYRYRLYQLLTEAGYTFDYVGSEDSGNDYFQNPEMDDNAGFPGINKDQMAWLLQTGYNPRTSLSITPGPYLNFYPADIILLHIGTVDLDASSYGTEQILNRIRETLPNAWILIARIIQRVPNIPLVTQYNNNVQTMVEARHDSRIVSVNMETGAGLDYSFSTDMTDYLHPNQNGYKKMAAKWFETIDNLNKAPVVSSIPEQTTNQGTGAFSNLGLDSYVTDAEDLDNAIQWTPRLQQNSKLSATVDANRTLHVTVADNTWYGSETITLKAKDSGNGAFQKSDSTQVIFTVIKKNEPPVITSAPITSTNEDANYSYTLVATDIDGNTLTYSAIQKPDWLTFSAATHALTGRPTNSEVGIYDITLRVSDGDENVDQSFQLTVHNVNDLPVITTTPVISVRVNESYVYEIMATDIDAGDVLTYSAESKPAWLTFSSGSASGILAGVPTLANEGTYAIILKVNDGHGGEVMQGYTLTALGPSSIDNIDNSIVDNVFPNPATETIYFKFAKSEKARIEIYDLAGTLHKQIITDNEPVVKINVADLPDGFYIYKVYQGNNMGIGKFTKE